INGTDLIGLTTHLIEQENEFANFLNRSYSANINYLGVKNALQLTSNATGTSVTVHIPSTGFTRTFMGASAEDVRRQIEDFIKKNGADEYARFQKSINESSKIAPLDGNPQAATAWLNAGAFSRFAFDPIADPRAFEMDSGGGFG